MLIYRGMGNYTLVDVSTGGPLSQSAARTSMKKGGSLNEQYYQRN